MILRTSATGFALALTLLAASSERGCRGPSPSPQKSVRVAPAEVPAGVFSIAGEVAAFRATGEAGRTQSVTQPLRFLRDRVGNFQRALLYEFDVTGERLLRQEIKVSDDWSISFRATAGNFYLVYADLGERYRNSYQLACRAGRQALSASLVPRLCTQIFCTGDTFRVEELGRRVPGLGGTPWRGEAGGGLAGGFGAGGSVCERCLESSFYPTEECSITLPGRRSAAEPTPEPLEGPPGDAAPGLIRIVSLGDSYASGEGAPDVNAAGCRRLGVLPHPQRIPCITPAQWKASERWNQTHTPVPSADSVCHRSTNAGARQAADAYAGVAGVPVEFVSVACTGAKIADLIGPAAAGGSRGNADKNVELQLDQVERLFPDRQRIDVLILGIGGNDVGFAEKVMLCMAPTSGCQESPHVGTGDNAPEKLARDLGERYDRLAAAMRDRLNVGTVMITEYPNPMYDDDGSVCDGEPEDDPLAGIKGDEARWAAETVIPTLNRTVREAAARHGWHYAGGVAAGFMRQGYCADDPFLNTVNRGLDIEGDSSAAVHPNVKGQGVYKAAILAKLQEMTPAIFASVRDSAPPAPAIVINRPNARGKSTVVSNNIFYIAWDTSAPDYTSVRTAYKHLGERDWRYGSYPAGAGDPTQTIYLAASGTIDFAVSVCTPRACSRWSEPVRASNRFETLPEPENLRLASLWPAPAPPDQFSIAKYNLSLEWDTFPHLPASRYQLAVGNDGLWSSKWVDNPEVKTANHTVFAYNTAYDLLMRQCAPRVWSRRESGPVTCSRWGRGLRFAAPLTTPVTPTLSILPTGDTVKPFTVKWTLSPPNQTGFQLAYVARAGEGAYSFLGLTAEQSTYTFVAQPVAVRVRACNQVGCSDWSEDVYESHFPAESLSAAPAPKFLTPPTHVPPQSLP